jgi:hypothetical protein
VAVLAVVHEVDADLALTADHIRDGLSELLLVARLVGQLALAALVVQLHQVLGPRQAPGVARQNAIGHRLLLR